MGVRRPVRAAFAGCLLLASHSNACNEHDANCTKQALPPISSQRKCKWRVMSGQIFEAVQPSIIQMNIGDKCSWEDDVWGFSFMCEDCSRSHQPCNNSHAACGGCSCSESKYAKDAPKNFRDLMKDLGRDNMTTHLTCDYIKEAFMFPNYNVVKCEEEKENREPEGDITAIRVDWPDAWDEATIETGVIHADCQVFPHKIGCKKVPFILKFECDDCVNKGSRSMLTKCCTRCKRFVDGLASNPNIPNDTLPIGYCSGCDSKYYTFEDSPMPEWPQAHWKDAGRFTDYTYAKAIETWEHYIEDNICTHLTPHCDVADLPDEGAEDYYLSENGEHYAEECHTGSCPADPLPDFVWSRPDEANGGGRRLVSMEPSNGSLYYCPESNSMMWAPKFVIKTIIGLPGPMEIYQTAEAKTALRHGFADTLQDVLESSITVRVYVAGGGRQLSVADVTALGNLSRRLSVVSVEFTINVPPTSTVAATAIRQNVESVAADNRALATNLEESFADYAPAIDVTTVDFNEAVVSELETVAREESTSTGTVLAEPEESTTGTPPTGIQKTDPVPRFAIVGAVVVLVLGLIGAGLMRRNKKNNGQEAVAVGNPVVPQEEKETSVPVVLQEEKEDRFSSILADT